MPPKRVVAAANLRRDSVEIGVPIPPAQRLNASCDAMSHSSEIEGLTGSGSVGEWILKVHERANIASVNMCSFEHMANKLLPTIT